MKKIIFVLLFLTICYSIKAENRVYKNNYAVSTNHSSTISIKTFSLIVGSDNSCTITIDNVSKSSTTIENDKKKAIENSKLEFPVFKKIVAKELIRENCQDIKESILAIIVDDFYDFYFAPQVSLIASGMTNFSGSEPKAFSTGVTGGFGISIKKNESVN